MLTQQQQQYPKGTPDPAFNEFYRQEGLSWMFLEDLLDEKT